MKELIKSIDAKTIREISLFLALAGALYIIYTVMTNDIQSIEAGIKDHNTAAISIQRETNEVLRNLSISIESNTKVLEAWLPTRR